MQSFFGSSITRAYAPSFPILSHPLNPSSQPNRKYSIYDAPAEDWEIILTLAHRWGFPEVKNLAVRELETKSMPDVKRIKLYHDTHVDRNFLIPRYAALCEREEPLSLAEGFDLGMETTLMIARGREEARASRSASGARPPCCAFASLAPPRVWQGAVLSFSTACVSATFSGSTST